MVSRDDGGFPQILALLTLGGEMDINNCTSVDKNSLPQDSDANPRDPR